ncbi:hypothetical protein K2Y00_01215 [Patescibacteria group bacterium]|nr:hypothetical protein [Patescibacteria group bacterium]
MKEKGTFTHIRPEEMDGPEQGRYHRFSVVENGTELGAAEVMYYGTPVPLYYILRLDVFESAQRGKGHASRIMNGLENMLTAHGKMGVVEDGIGEESGRAQGMYQRRKWRHIPGTEALYVFNPPKGYNLARLADLQLKLSSTEMREFRHRLTEKLRKLQAKYESE